MALLFALGLYVLFGLWHEHVQSTDEQASAQGREDDERERAMLQGRAPTPHLEGQPRPAVAPDEDDVELVAEESIVVEEPITNGERLSGELFRTDRHKGAWPGEPGWERERERFEPRPELEDRARLDQVKRGLFWFAAHQSSDGSWKADGFNKTCKGEPVEDPDAFAEDLGNSAYDVGVTGLAVCAFLGAGYTNRGTHPFKSVVSKGLRYLKNVQDPDGCFGARDDQRFLTNHALASLGMLEAYGMTLSPIFKGSAQRALDFIAFARRPDSAWGYRLRDGSGDAITTGLSLFPIRSAQLINKDAVARGRRAPLVVDEKAFPHSIAWLRTLTNERTGYVGYDEHSDVPWRPLDRARDYPAGYAPTPTATAVIAHVFGGADPVKDKDVRLSLRHLADNPPIWNPERGTVDAFYWWQGTLAAFLAGGSVWKTWRDAIRTEIVATQRTDDLYCDGKGSWDPVGVWGDELGRVGTTALMTMIASVYYRYDRVFGPK